MIQYDKSLYHTHMYIYIYINIHNYISLKLFIIFAQVRCIIDSLKA